MKRFLCMVALGTACSLATAQPHLARSEPADGASGVGVDVGVIRLYFDRNMNQERWTLWQTPKGEFPPMDGEDAVGWRDPRCLEVRVAKLKPDTLYAIQLNSSRRTGFRAADGTALEISAISFRTGGGAAAQQTPTDAQAPRGDAAPAPAAGGIAGLAPGATFRVTRTALVRGTITIQGGQRFPVRMLRQVEFIEKVGTVREGRAAGASRELVKAQVRQVDPETGQEDTETLGRAGQTYRLSFTGGGTRVSPAEGGSYPGEDLAEALKDSLDRGLIPAGPLREGQTWSLSGAEISAQFASLALRGGHAKLRVTGFETDRDTGLRVAKIQGEINTSIMLDELPVSYRAKLEVVVPVDLRVPFLTKLEGELSGRGTLEDEGQTISYMLSGEASAVQVAAPSAELVRSLGGKAPETPQAGPQVTQVPQRPRETPAPSARPVTLVCRRVAEPREKAFTFLLPRGWKVQGGIVRVNPMQAGGPANAVAAKCDMTIARDDAESVAFRILPTMEFAELPPTLPAAGMFPPGSNYQGMLVKPMPTPQAFLRECFQQVRPRAEGVRIVEEKPLPEMSAAYEKALVRLNQNLAMAGLPGIRASAGAIVVEYTEGGVRYKEALVTAIMDKRGSSFSWSNDSTYAARAPSSEAEAWKPVLEVVSKSIQLDPRWLAGEARGQGERTKIVLDTMREIHRIQDEMRLNSERTRSQIHEENYLVLTDQEDYVNPFTQKVERDTSLYERRWLTESGDIIYTNDREYDPNQDMTVPRSEWRVGPVKQR
jgi:hypothetical protein